MVWPFDDDEESAEPAATEDFNEMAGEIILQAPDLDSGLGALRSAYSDYDFEDRAVADSYLRERSNEIYQKFDARKNYSYEETLAVAPFDIDEFQGEGDDPETSSIDQINKWETKSIEELNTSDDPFYIQNKDYYSENIHKAAVTKRREVYGADNYLVTDYMLRAGQGLIGGVADLVGADDVNDWFTENTNREWDDSWGTAIFGGIGSAVGAIGAGVAGAAVAVAGAAPAAVIAGAATLGTGAYLAVSGAGSAKKQVEESLASGGTALEATGAGAIEAASQAGQALIGGKVFGKVAGKVASRLGAKVYPKASSIVGAGAMEFGAEYGGQMASNVATNVGQGTDIPITEGAWKSGVVGGFIGSGSTALGNVTARKAPTDNQADDPAANEALADAYMQMSQRSDLEDVLDETEGYPPPPRETVRRPSRVVEVDSPLTVLATREDGTTIAEADGRYHTEIAPQAIGEAHEAVFSVTPEIRETLENLKAASDGTDIPFIVENGKLYVNSPFVDDQLNPLDLRRPDRKTRVEVPATLGVQPGMYDVGANSVEVVDGVRTTRYKVGTSPIKDINSAGAAKAGFGGQKVHQTAQRERNRLGPELSEHQGIIAISSEEDAAGNRVDVETSLYTYFKRPNVKTGEVARDLIMEKGPGGSLDYLDSNNRGDNDLFNPTSVGDLAVARIMYDELMTAQERAYSVNDFKAADSFDPLISRAFDHVVRLANIGGTTLQAASDNASVGLGISSVEASRNINHINRSLRKAAKAQLETEFGEPVDLGQLQVESENADKVLADISAKVADPIDIRISEAEASIQELEAEKNTDAQKTIDKYESEISQLEEEKPANSKKLIEQRKKKIVDLERKKKEPSAAQKRLTKIIEDYQRTREGGGIIPEERKALTDAQRKANSAKARLTRATNVVNEHIARFPPEVQERLRTLYERLQDAPVSLGIHIRDAIFKIESQHLPPTPENVDALRKRFYRSVLSSVHTVMNNLTSILNTPASAGTFAAIDIFQIARGKQTTFNTAYYIGGFVKGLREYGILEAQEIMMGKRAARVALEEGPALKPKVEKNPKTKEIEKVYAVDVSTSGENFRNTSVGPVPYVNPIAHLKNIELLFHRTIGAWDAMTHAANREASAYLIAANMASEQKIPRKDVRAFIDEAMYRSETKKAAIQKSLDAQEEALKAVGIELTPLDKESAFYEMMEKSRDEVTREMSNRHGNRNISLSEMDNPASFGMLAKAVNWGAEHIELPLPGGKTLRPVGIIFPFVRVASGIADRMTEYTLFGLPSLAGLHRMRTNAIKAGEPDVYSQELREKLGNMVIGNAAIAMMVGVFKLYEDDKDPLISFTGMGDKREQYRRQEQNIPDFALKVGDNYIPKEVLGPLTLVFTLADAIQKSMKRGDNMAQAAGNSAMMSMFALSQLSMIKPVGEFFDMLSGRDVSGPDEGLGSRVTNQFYNRIASIATPLIVPGSGFLKNIYRWYDGSPQETYNNLTAKLAANIPVATEVFGGEKRLNDFGKEIEYTGLQRSPINSLLKRKSEDPVREWQARTGYTFTPQSMALQLTKEQEEDYGPYRATVLNTYRDRLSREESIEVLKIAGPQIRSYLETLRFHPKYSTYSEKEQQKIHNKVSSLRAKARQQVAARSIK